MLWLHLLPGIWPPLSGSCWHKLAEKIWMYTGLSISLYRLEPRAPILQSQVISTSCPPKWSTGQVPSQPWDYLGLSGGLSTITCMYPCLTM